MTDHVIAPSILSANFATLGEETNAVLAAGADWIHFDVMDNHFVPNLTIGPMVCQSLRDYGVTAPIDVHLMIEPVDRIIPDFAKAGATTISFHPEATDSIHDTIQLIIDNGCQPALAINPETSLDYLDDTLDKLSMVLIMGVNPGFGGQSFIPHTLQKLTECRRRIDALPNASIRLEVDGGVKIDNITDIAQAGADTFVAGSAIFHTPDYATTLQAFRDQLNLADR